MNKQEAIEKIKSKKISNKFLSNYGVGYNKALDDAIEIINQLDEPVRPPEPEKPKVPQFVAEYIEYCKHEKFYALNGAYANMDDRLKCWRFKGNNIELFAKAWLYGYEIEKEKLYTVELPNPNAGGHVVLCKTGDGRVSITFANAGRWRGVKNVQLTEAEIKQDFEWAWQFAKEVEE